MNRAKKIANKINKLSGINVFKNTRKKSYVEARSLLGFILKNYEKMTLYQIRDFYIENGKSMNHATVIHSIKNFQVFKNYEPQLIDWLNIISEDLDAFNNEAKRELIKLKVNYISNKDVDELSLTIDAMAKKELEV
tara:strand:+ start:701 stop:1108 length:408 start_codon:yes stop_codon:yes gene_type:complete